MIKSQEQLAVEYAEKQLGEQFGDILRVAENIADGAEPKTFNPEFLDSFGGAKEIKRAVEDSVTASQLKFAEKIKHNVLGLWSDAAGDTAAGGFGSLMNSNSTHEERISLLKDAFTQLQSGDAQDQQKNLQRIREIDEELEKGGSDYTTERLKQERAKLTEKTNNAMMSGTEDQARKQDARELTAIIAICGPGSTPTPELYRAILGK